MNTASSSPSRCAPPASTTLPSCSSLLAATPPPAITAAALIAAETDPSAVLWMMAADAAIQRTDALHEALLLAAAGARAGRIVTFGMKPHRAETAYGYLEVGPGTPRSPRSAYPRPRFLEKPDADTAARLVQRTAAIFGTQACIVFTAATLLQEMERYAPDVLEAVRTGRRRSRS